MQQWPSDADSLRQIQHELANAAPPVWQIPSRPRIAGCWICFPRGLTGAGDAGDPAWAAAVLLDGRHVLDHALRPVEAGAGYRPGLLALREGPALAEVVRALQPTPDVLLVNATGSDHPRQAGLALHLGAVLDLPSVGVTHRPLLASGSYPRHEVGDTSPLLLDDQVVGHWVRTRAGTRPLAVDAGWRSTPEQAVRVVMLAHSGHRTPEPLRRARQLARVARRLDTERPDQPTAPPT